MNNIYEEIFSSTYGFSVDELNETNSSNIRKSIAILRGSYRKDTPITPYEENQIRKAYMLAYYPNYMKLSYDLTKSYIAENLIREKGKNRIKITFFAAGPAPETAGVLMALNDMNCSNRLEVSILDLEKGWEEERKATSSLINEMKNLKLSSLIHISGCDLSIDCKKGCNNWTACENNIFKNDIYYMENCINHMSKEVDFKERLKRKLEDIKSGALFVIVDLNYDNVRDVMMELKTKCEQLVEVIGTNIESGISKSRLDVKLPEKIQQYIFIEKDNLIAKKNTNYYYMILKRK